MMITIMTSTNNDSHQENDDNDHIKISMTTMSMITLTTSMMITIMTTTNNDSHQENIKDDHNKDHNDNNVNDYN